MESLKRIAPCLALVMMLGACTSSTPLVQRCPAIKPQGLSCDTAWSFNRDLFPDSPEPIEALQSRYQDALGLLEEADTAMAECRALDRVWTKGWDDCGK